MYDKGNIDYAELHAFSNKIVKSFLFNGGSLSETSCSGMPKCENTFSSSLLVDPAVGVVIGIAPGNFECALMCTNHIYF